MELTHFPIKSLKFLFLLFCQSVQSTVETLVIANSHWNGMFIHCTQLHVFIFDNKLDYFVCAFSCQLLLLYCLCFLCDYHWVGKLFTFFRFFSTVSEGLLFCYRYLFVHVFFLSFLPLFPRHSKPFSILIFYSRAEEMKREKAK